MKLLGYIILACVVLAALQAALTLALVLGGILLLIGVFTCTAETFGFLIVCGFYWVLQHYPAAGLCLVGLFMLVAILLPKGDGGAAPEPTATLPAPGVSSKPND